MPGTIVFDNVTQLPTVASPDEILQDTKRYSPIENKIIPLKSPDGKITAVHGTQLSKAFAGGWTIPTVAEEQKEAHFQKTEEQMGGVGVALNSAENEALMGVPAALESPEEKEERKRHEELHPASHIAGSALGIGTNLLSGPGEIVGAAGDATKDAIMQGGKEAVLAAGQQAAESGLVKKLVGHVAAGAVEGALYSTPQAAAELVVKNPEQAAETMLWGAGLGGVVGGVFGGGSELIGKGVQKGASAIDSASVGPDVQKWAKEKLSLQHGLSAADVDAIGPKKWENALNVLDKEGLLTKKTKLADYEAIRKDSGGKIGEYRSAVDSFLSNPEKIDPLADTITDNTTPARDLAPSLKTAKENAFKLITESDSPALNGIASGGLNPATGLLEGSPFLEKARNHLQDLMDKMDVASVGGSITDSQGKTRHLMDEFTQEKARLGSLTKWVNPKMGGNESINRINQIMYGSIRDEEHRAMTELMAKMQNGDLAGYMNQKNRYEAARDLIWKGNPANSRSDFGKIPGGQAVGGLSGIAALYAGLSGHPAVAAGFYAKKVAANWANETGLPKIAAYIRKVANNPQTSSMLGPMLAKDATTGFQKVLQKIPDLISGAGSKATNVAARLATSYAFKDFLGTSASGLSKDKQYDKITADILQIQRDPKLFANNIQHIMGVFGDNPEIAHMLATKHANAINYLASTIPKNPNGPQPFQKNDWKPTAEQKEEFAERLAVVNNPMIVFDHIKTGHISNAMVDTLKNVYPSIYSAFSTVVGNHAFTPAAENTSYAAKIALSKLLNTPLDKSLTMLPAIQATYQSGQQPVQQKSGGRSKKATLDKLPSTQTQIQRLDAKANK